MKQAVGIGGAKVDISLDAGAAPLGGFAKGRVILRGGKSEQKCNAIEARLERVTTVRVVVDGKSQNKEEVETVHSETLASYHFTIHAESEQLFDFAFKLPREHGTYRIYADRGYPRGDRSSEDGAARGDRCTCGGGWDGRCPVADADGADAARTG